MLKKALALALALIIIFPLLYAVSLSLFAPRDFNASPARFFPEKPMFENYVKAIGHSYFLRYTMNSLITALLASLIRTLIVLLSSYAFSFLHFRWKKAILFFLLLSAFIPQDSLLYENYVTAARLNLLNTYMGIIITSLFSATQLMMLMTAMKSLSKDTFDAARVDGANDITVLFHIIAPLTKSIIITIFLQSFIGVFNAYLWPLLVTNTAEIRTIQIGISLMGYQESGRMGPLFATLLLVLIPFVILTVATKKLIIKALADGLSY